MRRTILLMGVLALVLASCGNDGGGGEAGGDLLEEVMSEGTLVVATDPAYPPFSSYDEGTSTWEGFDVEVANEVAKRMGVDLHFATPNWEEILAGGWGNDWQLSIGSMTATVERQQVLLFSPAYYYTPAVLAVHETNTTITGQADLTGGTVGVCGVCTSNDYVEGTLRLVDAPPFEFQLQDADVKFYEGSEGNALAIRDLAAGDTDAILDSQPAIQRAIDEGDPYKILQPPLYIEPLVVAMDKEAPADPISLVTKVSDIIQEMHTDGTLATLSCKWFGVDYSVSDPSQAQAC